MSSLHVRVQLNGGPGCSSLAGGFMSELGPYYPTKGGKLRKNAFSWTHQANIVFLEVLSVLL